jgi:ubiquinone biosynthesis protein
MWDTAAPYVRSWIRDELGPEAALADRLKQDTETLFRLPGLIRRLEEQYPPKGGAPDLPPLPDIELMWERRRKGAAKPGNPWHFYLLSGLVGAGAVAGALALGFIG